MARIASLNVLLSTTGNDYLAEKYGAVVANVQKNCISQALKNTALSGTPGAGQAIKVTPVTVAVSVDKEIIVEAETKDVTLYGVDNLVEREAASAQKSMVRELEKAFFAEAVTAGSAVTPTGTTAEEIAEELIQAVETVNNNFVDGVERDMISLVCSPAFYGQLRTYLDRVEHDGQSERIPLFHGVKVYSSVYLPANTNAICMADGSIAQPVLPTVAPAQKVPLSNAIAFGLFYSYGTKAVAPDLIFKY